MKRFNVETCTKEEFERRRKCWSTKQEVWDLLDKFYQRNHDTKTFEENMIILSIKRLINDLDIDKVIAEAYGQKLED